MNPDLCNSISYVTCTRVFTFIMDVSTICSLRCIKQINRIWAPEHIEEPSTV